MKNAVIKGASYTLAHSPDLLKRNGSTQTAAIAKDPADPYIAAIPSHLRTFEQAVQYPPNQVYIGNKKPEDLSGSPEPWFKCTEKADRFGPFGEIATQKELYILMKYADVFELVYLTEEFTAEAATIIQNHPVMKDKAITLGEAHSKADIEKLVQSHTAEGLYDNDVLVGCVKQAHDTDPNLSAHTMLENLVTKGSGILTAWHLAGLEGIDAADIDYIIECSEEAAGDVNQRGGGNIAKSVGEKAGCVHATGCDIRGFCAAPVHALANAAALVRSGIFKNVMVVAGEIRKLAEESSAQGKTISGTLKMITAEIDQLVKAASLAVEKFTVISQHTDAVQNSASMVAFSMTEQSKAGKEVLSSMQDINAVTQSVQQGSAEISGGSEKVMDEVRNLDKVTHTLQSRMEEIASNFMQINNSIYEVKSFTERNKESINRLVGEVEKFKV